MCYCLYSGYLSKRGHGRFRSNWKPRYFVLEMGRLSYFEKEDESGEPPYGRLFLKSLVLRNVSISHHDDASMILLIDSISGYDMRLKADSVDTAEVWRKVRRKNVLYMHVLLLRLCAR
jgi:hypothetical protein